MTEKVRSVELNSSPRVVVLGHSSMGPEGKAVGLSKVGLAGVIPPDAQHLHLIYGSGKVDIQHPHLEKDRFDLFASPTHSSSPNELKLLFPTERNKIHSQLNQLDPDDQEILQGGGLFSADEAIYTKSLEKFNTIVNQAEAHLYEHLKMLSKEGVINFIISNPNMYQNIVMVHALNRLLNEPDEEKKLDINVIAIVHDVGKVMGLDGDPNYSLIDWTKSPFKELCEYNPQYKYVTPTLNGKTNLLRLWKDDSEVPENVIGQVVNPINDKELIGYQPIAALVNKEQLNDARGVIFTPGGPGNRKYPEFTVKVMEHLKGTGIKLVWSAFGAQDDLERYNMIKSRIKEAGIEDQVIDLYEQGMTDDAVINAMYRYADALFFPSKWEGYGRPAREANVTAAPVQYLTDAAAVIEDYTEMVDMSKVMGSAYNSLDSELRQQIEALDPAVQALMTQALLGVTEHIMQQYAPVQQMNISKTFNPETKKIIEEEFDKEAQRVAGLILQRFTENPYHSTRRRVMSQESFSHQWKQLATLCK